MLFSGAIFGEGGKGEILEPVTNFSDLASAAGGMGCARRVVYVELHFYLWPKSKDCKIKSVLLDSATYVVLIKSKICELCDQV